MYQIEFAGRAQRAFRNLSADIQRRLDPAILALANNPRPPGCTKLAGKESLWRIRVGDYRIVYQIQDDRLLVLVVKVGRSRELRPTPR
jgi:mRNA interferase RelE/StbE